MKKIGFILFILFILSGCGLPSDCTIGTKTIKDLELCNEIYLIKQELSETKTELSDLREELCNIGASGFDCYCSRVEFNVCDEDGELSCKDWRGLMLCKNYTCSPSDSPMVSAVFYYYNKTR